MKMASLSSEQSWSELRRTVEQGGTGTREGLARAIALADSLPLPSDQETIDALYGIAAAAEALDQFDLAEAQYERILNCATANPATVVAAHYRRGLCLQRLAHVEQAIEQFELAAAKGPGWPAVGRLARWEVSGILLRAGKLEQPAIHCRALLDEPDCEPMCRLEVRARRCCCLFGMRHPEAVAEWEAICELIPQTDIEGQPSLRSSLFEAAVAAELNGRLRLASRFYELVLQKENVSAHTSASAAYRLAVCLEQRGKWTESMAHYRSAIQKGTGLPQVPTLARVQLGMLLLAAEEYAAAAELYAELCADPSELHIPLAEAYYRLAFCLFRSGDDQEAERVLRRIPDRGAAQEFLARVDHLLAEIFERRKEYGSAAACYRRLIDNSEAEIPVKAAALHRVAMLRAFEA
jgi:tetratricopeptide (TPR) repeat protein